VTAINNVGKLQYVFILRIVCRESLLYICISLFFELMTKQTRLKGRHKLMYTMNSALFNAGNIFGLYIIIYYINYILLMLVIYWNYILEYTGMLDQERDRWRALVGTMRDFRVP